MGSIRLRLLPTTRAWKEVVALIAGGADAWQVDAAAARAAAAAFRRAANDPGVVESIWLLMQLPQAAKEDDFAHALRQRGLAVPEDPGTFDLAAAVTEAVDARLANCNGRSDLGEIAQNAAAESVAAVLGGRADNFFGAEPADVREAARGLGTVKQFGLFAEDFFARFFGRTLNSYLSRVLADHTGPSRRFPTLALQADFTDSLTLHCREAARVVREYSGQWYSKTLWEDGGISRDAVAGFTGYAMTKLTGELQQGAVAGVN